MAASLDRGKELHKPFAGHCDCNTDLTWTLRSPQETALDLSMPTCPILVGTGTLIS